MAEPAVPMRVTREYGDTIPIETLNVSDTVHQDTYNRAISPEERASYAEKVVDLSLKIDNKEEEKKETVKMLGEEIKMSKTERRQCLRILKNGTVEVADKIYTFLDHDNRLAFEYNSAGMLVRSRRMRPEETQANVFQ